MGMCGIAAVLARPARRPAPSEAALRELLGRAREPLVAVLSGRPGPSAHLAVRAGTAVLAELDRELRGVPGLEAMLAHDWLCPALGALVEDLGRRLDSYEAALDGDGALVDQGSGPEDLNAALVGLRDVLWALGADRAGAARSVAELVGPLGLGRVPHRAALGVLWSCHVALRSLDRLEVRGRDSAGLHLMVWDHGLDGLSGEEAGRALLGRDEDELFASGSVRRVGNCLSMVYKAAAEIGELGDNVRALRQALAGDPLLARVLRSPEVRATVLAHTRWASVGLVSEPNAHPLNSEQAGGRPRGGPAPYAVGVLNGDIDNHAQLVAEEGMSFPAEVTTDAKLVPAMVARYMERGAPGPEALARSVRRFAGSVGIAVNLADQPGHLLLALRGSGQGLGVGLAEDAFVVASEPYGLVEEAASYLRMDGSGTGQLVQLDQALAGEPDGVLVSRGDGALVPMAREELCPAEVTTRDIDRQGFPHFLLKEISEAPLSVRKTLRGKLVGRPGAYAVHLGDGALGPALRAALAAGRIHDVVTVGQGTAAVAARAVASAIGRALPGATVTCMPASELSGWGPDGRGLPDDMSGALVVAVSQSGTTTDTNRAVDLVRGRGAFVVSIVNRRQSDLVQKSDGVIYTSDGRDVEMSVASTKAFYSQVAAGHLLAAALASQVAPGRGSDRQAVLAALRELPGLMSAVLAKRAEIGRLAALLAPSRRNWAVAGSGPDHVAAAEIRIKLSELCYKAIALDTVEDKKHIDLSAEPLVIVCAAGAGGPNLPDLVKEVGILKAHKAAPVVIVSEAQRGAFDADVDLVSVPECHPELAFVLAAMVGHLFGYEAALAIDALARPLREARALLEGEGPAGALGPPLSSVLAPALDGMLAGAYDGHLSASAVARLVALAHYATGTLPVEGYEAETGRLGTPDALAGDLLAALSRAVDELARPVDAIKHQAKTVTVGTSRSEDELLGSPLVAQALAAGASSAALGYRALRSLAALAPAVHSVLGYTRYRVEPDEGVPQAALSGARLRVLAQGGVAQGLVSRSVTDPVLRGTKHRAAQQRQVTVFKSLYDGRTGVIIPEVPDGKVAGITLLHVRFAGPLPAGVARAVLEGYQGRYAALVDAVTEACPGFDDTVLGRVGMLDLLTEPVAVLARHWASPGA